MLKEKKSMIRVNSKRKRLSDRCSYSLWCSRHCAYYNAGWERFFIAYYLFKWCIACCSWIGVWGANESGHLSLFVYSTDKALFFLISAERVQLTTGVEPHMNPIQHQQHNESLLWSIENLPGCSFRLIVFSAESEKSQLSANDLAAAFLLSLELHLEPTAKERVKTALLVDNVMPALDCHR